MITPELLNEGHSLSETSQPPIGDLVRLLRDDGVRITFVIGAGASVDAGLPAWQSLVKNILKSVDPAFAPIANDDRDDPMRKAEYVLNMAIRRSGGTPKHHIQTALYDGVSEVTPGQLIISLCDLIALLHPRVAVITTNFDQALEKALSEIRLDWQAFTIKTKNGWFDSVAAPSGFIPIMHLHGIVPRDGKATGPVVLTESHFLREGPAARDIVRDALMNTVTVFVGVSLTDPNLVGPLWDTSRKHRPAFALTVPTPTTDNEDVRTTRAYALSKSEYLERSLALNVIALKSFGQLEQLVRELAISNSNPDLYDGTDPGTSLHYGIRFRRRLESCYATLGGTPPTYHLEVSERVETSARLSENLSSGAIGRKLKALRDSRGVRAELERLCSMSGDSSKIDEVFGISLWLRTFGDTPDDIYSLKLVATTQLVPTSESYMASVPIEPLSPVLESRCLFRGVPVVLDLPRMDFVSGWRAGAASPVRAITKVAGQGGTEWNCSETVGAICLTTTAHVLPAPTERRGNWKVSLLAALDRQQRAELTALLEVTARELFGISPH